MILRLMTLDALGCFYVCTSCGAFSVSVASRLTAFSPVVYRETPRLHHLRLLHFLFFSRH